jgi:hypothetical protein
MSCRSSQSMQPVDIARSEVRVSVRFDTDQHTVKEIQNEWRRSFEQEPSEFEWKEYSRFFNVRSPQTRKRF